MPIYGYRCNACGVEIEKRQSFHDDPLTVCEACGGELRRLLHPVGIVFKGSGFYNTDNRKSGSTNGGSSGSSNESSKSASETGSGSSSESGSSSSTESSTPSTSPSSSSSSSTPAAASS